MILHLRPDGTFSHLLVAVGPSPETIKTNANDNAAIIVPYRFIPECDQRHFLQFSAERVYTLEIDTFLRKLSHVGFFNPSL